MLICCYFQNYHLSLTPILLCDPTSVWGIQSDSFCLGNNYIYDNHNEFLFFNFYFIVVQVQLSAFPLHPNPPHIMSFLMEVCSVALPVMGNSLPDC